MHDNQLTTRCLRGLNLGVDSNDPKDEPLRRSLGYPSDEIQVHESSNRVVARFCIRMFQKRLRTTQNMRYEFIAEGRIWSLRFFILPTTGVWRTELSLSQDSFPARPDAVLVIKARKLGRCSIPHKAAEIIVRIDKA
ncbi:hypothetical protein EDB19DRAFT_541299 [Suillus lakei]|nr:hypothetical protein EDB19DRAFT_541299 [Suillus lakei]